jgi:hypothetical protein
MAEQSVQNVVHTGHCSFPCDYEGGSLGGISFQWLAIARANLLEEGGKEEKRSEEVMKKGLGKLGSQPH